MINDFPIQQKSSEYIRSPNLIQSKVLISLVNGRSKTSEYLYSSKMET